MSYYQGDFFPRRAYRSAGDFLGIGKLFKKAVGYVAPVVEGVIDRWMPGVGTAIAKVAQGSSNVVKSGARVVAAHPVLSAAGAAGALAGAAGIHHMVTSRGGAAPMVGGVGAPGYHLSRRSGRMVRNRHMNVCNPRALRRSIRRASGFAKLAMKTIRFTHPHKKGRFGGFKRRSRK